MSILKELLPGQHIRIDNHQRGVPMKWDWEPGEQPDAIHLDKTMNRKVNGKEVKNAWNQYEKEFAAVGCTVVYLEHTDGISSSILRWK